MLPPMRPSAALSAVIPVSLPGWSAPAAGFDDPFAMLAACHDRVQRSLALLRRLVEHLQSSGLDADARTAAHDVWRYFELAAPAHHLDEEHHVLPRLRASGDPWLAALAQRIENDHREIEAIWHRLGPLLCEVHEATSEVATAAATTLAQRLRREADAFIELHERHIPLEDRLAFPSARERMSPAERDAMGAEMAQRRQPRR